MSDVVQGLAVSFRAELEEFDRRMKESGRLVEVAASGMDKSTQRAARSFQRLEGALDPLARATQRYQRDVDLVQAAVDKGVVSQDRAAQVMARLRDQYDRASTAARVFEGAAQTANRTSVRMGGAIQNVGFQVGDFATQIASGTNPMRAFIQQGTQMVSMFGPWGAAIGAAGAVVGALVVSLVDLAGETEDATEATYNHRDAMQAAEEIMKRIDRLGQSRTEQIREERDALIEAAEAEVARAREAVASAEARYRATQLADPETAFTVGNVVLMELRELRAAVDDADEKLAEMRAKFASSEQTLKTWEEANDSAGKAVARHAEQVGGAIYELEREVTLLNNLVPLYESGAISLEQLTFQRRLEAEYQKLGLAQGSEEAAMLELLMRRREEMTERIEAQKSAEQEAVKAAERALEEQRRALERHQEEIARTVGRVGDRVAEFLGDSFYDQLTKKNVDVWESFKDIALRTVAELAAELATQSLVIPVVTRLVGGAGAGLSTESGNGLPSLPGGNLFGDMTGAIDRFGVSTGLFGGGGAPLTAAQQLAVSGPLGGPAASGAAAQAVPSGLLGSTSLSSFLGGAGAGAGAGMLLNSLVGGSQTGGMLGSAGGALAGAALGSVVPGVGTLVGGLIGGSGGGLLGGLFGGGTQPTVGPNSTAAGALRNGLAALTDSAADNGGSVQRSVALLSNLAQALDQVSTAAARDIGVQQARVSVMEETGQITVEAAGQVGVFSSETEALLFGLQALAGNMAGLDGEMERVIRGADSLQTALADLATIAEIDALPMYFGQTTQLEQQVAELTGRYAELTDAAERLSLSEGRRLRILEAQAAELAYLRGTFERDIERQMLELTNSGSAALAQLQDELVETLRSGAAVGADLVRIEELYGARRLAAVQRFSEAQLRALEGGTQLDRSLAAYEQARRDIERQIEGIESPLADFVAAVDRFRANLQQVIDGFRTDPSLSPLSPADRLAEARGIFARTVGQAEAGDPAALDRVAEDARTLLEASRAYNASSVAYAQDFTATTQALQDLGVGLAPAADVQETQLERLTQIRDLLANPTGIDIASLQAALQAVGISGELAPLVARLGETQSSAQRESRNSGRDALQESYAQLRDAARGGDRQAASAWVDVARRAIETGAFDRSGINRDAADIRERGFSVPSFARGGAFTVPPGGGNDSVLAQMRVQSGERVRVERAEDRDLQTRNAAALEENNQLLRQLGRRLLNMKATG